MTDQVVRINGEDFYLGLLPPEDGIRPMTFAPLPDSFMLTKKQVEEITHDARRTPRRKLFDGEQWIWSQGRVGSCTAQAGAGAAMRIRYFRNLTYHKLSGSGLYALVNRGRDSGSALEAVRRVITERGVPSAEGLSDSKFYTQLSPEVLHSMSRFKVETFRLDTEDQLASAVAQNMMCVIAVHVDKMGRYQSLSADGVRGSTSGVGNHAVACVDVFVKNNRYYFDEAGSWGLRNGQRGYAYLTWDGHLKSTNRNHAFFAIHTCVDDPEDPNRINLT